MLTKDQLKLLTLIANKSGNTNWYKIGRLHLAEFTSPAEFDSSMKYLLEAALVEEKLTDDAKLPNLFVTQKGLDAIAPLQH